MVSIIKLPDKSLDDCLRDLPGVAKLSWDEINGRIVEKRFNGDRSYAPLQRHILQQLKNNEPLDTRVRWNVVQKLAHALDLLPVVIIDNDDCILNSKRLRDTHPGNYAAEAIRGYMGQTGLRYVDIARATGEDNRELQKKLRPHKRAPTRELEIACRGLTLRWNYFASKKGYGLE